MENGGGVESEGIAIAAFLYIVLRIWKNFRNEPTK
jgi:hypothetical protein